jgi:hypothetical protein
MDTEENLFISDEIALKTGRVFKTSPCLYLVHKRLQIN